MKTSYTCQGRESTTHTTAITLRIHHIVSSHRLKTSAMQTRDDCINGPSPTSDCVSVLCLSVTRDLASCGNQDTLNGMLEGWTVTLCRRIIHLVIACSNLDRAKVSTYTFLSHHSPLSSTFITFTEHLTMSKYDATVSRERIGACFSSACLCSSA